MKYATLTRWCYGIDFWGTFGSLVIPQDDGTELRLYTVERPWRNNERGVSCIPEGLYHVSPYSRPSNGDGVYILQGRTVSHFDQPGIARFGVLIHAANRCDEVQGCIAPGVAIAPNAPLVTSSRVAMRMLRQHFGEDDWMLSIDSVGPARAVAA
ncbi:MAG: DUF5675 family protein [Pseudomonadota bacterium]